MKRPPVYAPLQKQFSFPAELTAAAEALIPQTGPDPITHRNGRSVHDTEDGALTRYLQIKDLVVNHQDENGAPVRGSFDGFRSLNLTWVPEDADSKHRQFYHDHENRKRAYLFRPGSVWQWREDIDTAHFRNFVNGLGLRRISLVRLIYLIPPAVGGVHIDTSPASMQNYYQTEDGVSLTFNLLPGDGALYFMTGGQIFSIPPQKNGWHFDPSVPHSVGRITRLRVQLRVFGSMAPADYRELLDLTEAVWHPGG